MSQQPNDAGIVSERPDCAAGDNKAEALIHSCRVPSGTPSTNQEFLACLPRSCLGKGYSYFIPDSQAWQPHLIDVAIFGGLAVLLLVGTGWLLRRQS